MVTALGDFSLSLASKALYRLPSLTNKCFFGECLVSNKTQESTISQTWNRKSSEPFAVKMQIRDSSKTLKHLQLKETKDDFRDKALSIQKLIQHCFLLLYLHYYFYTSIIMMFCLLFELIASPLLRKPNQWPCSRYTLYPTKVISDKEDECR